MKRRWLFLCCAVCLTLAGCASKTRAGQPNRLYPMLPQSTSAAQGEADKNTAQLIPDRLKRDASGVPMLSVYDVKAEKLETLSVEDYLPAVLAGEMAGDSQHGSAQSAGDSGANICHAVRFTEKVDVPTARISRRISKRRRHTTHPVSTTASVRQSAKRGAW